MCQICIGGKGWWGRGKVNMKKSIKMEFKFGFKKRIFKVNIWIKILG